MLLSMKITSISKSLKMILNFLCTELKFVQYILPSDLAKIASRYNCLQFSSNTNIIPSINNHFIRELNMVTVSTQNFFQGDETPSLMLHNAHRYVVKMGRISMSFES